MHNENGLPPLLDEIQVSFVDPMLRRAYKPRKHS